MGRRRLTGCHVPRRCPSCEILRVASIVIVVLAAGLLTTAASYGNNVIVDISLTDGGLLAGVTLTTCDNVTSTGCSTGGLPFTYALARGRHRRVFRSIRHVEDANTTAAVDHYYATFVPNADALSSFVSVHPLGRGVNVALYDRLGISAFLVPWPSTLDDADIQSLLAFYPAGGSVLLSTGRRTFDSPWRSRMLKVAYVAPNVAVLMAIELTNSAVPNVIVSVNDTLNSLAAARQTDSMLRAMYRATAKRAALQAADGNGGQPIPQALLHRRAASNDLVTVVVVNLMTYRTAVRLASLPNAPSVVLIIYSTFDPPATSKVFGVPWTQINRTRFIYRPLVSDGVVCLRLNISTVFQDTLTDLPVNVTIASSNVDPLTGMTPALGATPLTWPTTTPDVSYFAAQSTLTSVTLLVETKVNYTSTVHDDALFTVHREILKNESLIARQFDRVVGYLTSPVAGEPPPRRCNWQESPVGSLAADAWRWKLATDVAFQLACSSSNDADWPAGDITASRVFSANVFPDVICTGRVLGLHLWEMLSLAYNRAPLAVAPQAFYNLQVSGMRVVVAAKANGSTDTPILVSRVLSVDVYNSTTGVFAPLQRLQYYTFATTSYVCTAVDTSFVNAVMKPSYRDEWITPLTEFPIQQAIIEYLRVVSPVRIAKDGRLTVLLDVANESTMRWTQSPSSCSSEEAYKVDLKTCQPKSQGPPAVTAEGVAAIVGSLVVACVFFLLVVRVAASSSVVAAVFASGTWSATGMIFLRLAELAAVIASCWTVWLGINDDLLVLEADRSSAIVSAPGDGGSRTSLEAMRGVYTAFTCADIVAGLGIVAATCAYVHFLLKGEGSIGKGDDTFVDPVINAAWKMRLQALNVASLVCVTFPLLVLGGVASARTSCRGAATLTSTALSGMLVGTLLSDVKDIAKRWLDSVTLLMRRDILAGGDGNDAAVGTGAATIRPDTSADPTANHFTSPMNAGDAANGSDRDTSGGGSSGLKMTRTNAVRKRVLESLASDMVVGAALSNVSSKEFFSVILPSFRRRFPRPPLAAATTPLPESVVAVSSPSPQTTEGAVDDDAEPPYEDTPAEDVCMPPHANPFAGAM